MDYGRRELADALAAQYVLGTLRGPARRRFEALLPAHPALGEAVAQWRQRLEPLALSVPAVQPSPQVWQRIEQRLFSPGAAAAAAPHQTGLAPSAPPSSSALPALPWWQRLALPWWQRLSLWRGLSALAGTAVLGLLVLLLQAPPPQAPVLVVLAANPPVEALPASGAAPANAQTPPALNARFVASISADGRALVLRPLNDLTISASQALELWAVPAQGAPRSLGLVRGDAATTLLRTQLLRDTAAFAVSVEPAGGSPTGAPTGPIVSVGKLQI